MGFNLYLGFESRSLRHARKPLKTRCFQGFFVFLLTTRASVRFRRIPRLAAVSGKGRDKDKIIVPLYLAPLDGLRVLHWDGSSLLGAGPD